MARLMLSAGIFSALAARIAVLKRGFESGSPPPIRAATVISLINLVKIFPRRASAAHFLCLIVAHLEWPDIIVPFGRHARLREGTFLADLSDSTICRTEAHRSSDMLPQPQALGYASPRACRLLAEWLWLAVKDTYNEIHNDSSLEVTMMRRALYRAVYPLLFLVSFVAGSVLGSGRASRADA